MCVPGFMDDVTRRSVHETMAGHETNTCHAHSCAMYVFSVLSGVGILPHSTHASDGMNTPVPIPSMPGWGLLHFSTMLPLPQCGPLDWPCTVDWYHSAQ